MAARLLGVLASLALQVACVDRTMDDTPAPYDPAADKRTKDEVLRDFCELYVACKFDAPVLVDEPTCWWYFDFIHGGFERSPEKPPECAEALRERLACASEADSCMEFTASYSYRMPYSNHRCDEPLERFDAADCAR